MGGASVDEIPLLTGSNEIKGNKMVDPSWNFDCDTSNIYRFNIIAE